MSDLRYRKLKYSLIERPIMSKTIIDHYILLINHRENKSKPKGGGPVWYQI